MSDGSVEAIKVKLELQTGNISAGVTAAAAELDKLNSEKPRLVKLAISPQLDAGTKAWTTFKKDVQKGFQLPIGVSFSDTGASGIAAMRKQVSAALAAGGGIKVPFATEMTKRQGQDVRKALQAAVTEATSKTAIKAHVKWDFGEGPKEPPIFRQKILIDWDWGSGPGGTPAAGGGSGRGPRGGSRGPAGGGNDATSRAAAEESRESERASRESIRYHRWRRANTQRQQTNARAGATDPGTGTQSTANANAERQRRRAEREETVTATQAAQTGAQSNRARAQRARSAPAGAQSATGQGWRDTYKGTVHNCPEPGCRYGGTSEASLQTHLTGGHHKKGQQRPPSAPAAAPARPAPTPRSPAPGGQSWRDTYKGTVHNCPEPGCRWGGTSEANLQTHLAGGHHKKGQASPAAARPAAAPTAAPVAAPAAEAAPASPAPAARARTRAPRAAHPVAATPAPAQPAVTANILGLPLAGDKRSVASSIQTPQRVVVRAPTKAKNTLTKCQECGGEFSNLEAHMVSHNNVKVGSHWQKKGGADSRPLVQCDECSHKTKDLAKHKKDKHGVVGTGDIVPTSAPAGVAAGVSVEELQTQAAGLQQQLAALLTERQALVKQQQASSAGRPGTQQVNKGKTSRRHRLTMSGTPKGPGRSGGTSTEPAHDDPDRLRYLNETIPQTRKRLTETRDTIERDHVATRDAADRTVAALLKEHGSYVREDPDDPMNRRLTWVAKEGSPDMESSAGLTKFVNGLNPKDKRRLGQALGLWLSDASKHDVSDTEEGSVAQSGELVSAIMGVLKRRAERTVGTAGTAGGYSGVARAGQRGRKGENKSRGGEAVAVKPEPYKVLKHLNPKSTRVRVKTTPEERKLRAAASAATKAAKEAAEAKRLATAQADSQSYQLGSANDIRVPFAGLSDTKTGSKAVYSEGRLGFVEGEVPRTPAERIYGTLAEAEKEAQSVARREVRTPFLPGYDAKAPGGGKPENRRQFVDVAHARAMRERELVDAYHRKVREFELASALGEYPQRDKKVVQRDAAAKWKRRQRLLRSPASDPLAPRGKWKRMGSLEPYDMGPQEVPGPKSTFGDYAAAVSPAPERPAEARTPIDPSIPMRPGYANPVGIQPTFVPVGRPRQLTAATINPDVAQSLRSQSVPPEVKVPYARATPVPVAGRLTGTPSWMRGLDPGQREVAGTPAAGGYFSEAIPYAPLRRKTLTHKRRARLQAAPVYEMPDESKGASAETKEGLEQMMPPSLQSLMGIMGKRYKVRRDKRVNPDQELAEGGAFTDRGGPYATEDFVNYYADRAKQRDSEAADRAAGRSSDKFGRPPQCTAWSDKRPGGCPLPSGHSGPHDVPGVGSSSSTSGPESICPCGHDRAKHAMLGSHSACDACSCPKFGSGTNSRVEKLKSMAATESYNPNEAKVARSMLRRRGVEGYAEGGSLLERLAKAGNQSAIDRLKDRPITASQEETKDVFEPAWLRRGREGEGVSKDMTRYAEGGDWSPARQIEQKILDFEKYKAYNDGKWGKGYTVRIIQKLRDQQEQLKKPKGFADGGDWEGWDKPALPNPNPIPYQYPDDYRPGRGPTEWEDRKWGRVPKAPSRYPDWEDYTRGRVPKAPSPYPEYEDYSDKKAHGFAEGGILKHSGILQSAQPKSVTEVGERGRELIVTGQDGRTEVVPNQKVSSYLGMMQQRAGGGGLRGLFQRTDRSVGRRVDALTPAPESSGFGLAAINVERRRQREAREALRSHDPQFTQMAQARRGAEEQRRMLALTDPSRLLTANASPPRTRAGFASSNVNAARTPEVIPLQRPIAERFHTSGIGQMLQQAAGPIAAAAATAAAATPVVAAAAGAAAASSAWQAAVPGIAGAFPFAAHPGAAVGAPALATAAGPILNNAQAAAAAGQPAPVVAPAPAVAPAAAAGPAQANYVRTSDMTTARLLKLDAKSSHEDIESKIQYAKQMTPARAFTTQVAQIGEQLFGRSGIQKRARQAETATSVSKQAEALQIDSEAKVGSLKEEIKLLQTYRTQGNISKAQRTRLTQAEKGDLPVAEKASQAAAMYAAQAKEKAAVKAMDILRPGDVIKNVVVGFIGLAGATIAMKAAFGAINTGMNAAEQSIGKWIEAQAGFINTSSQLQLALGSATKEQLGNVKAVVASTLAMSGLAATTAADITPALTQRATTIAGNQAAQQRMEQIAAGSGNGGIGPRPAGLGEGYDVNLVKSVGGFMNLGVGPGSTAPTAEVIQQQLGMVSGDRTTTQVVPNSEVKGRKVDTGGAGFVWSGLINALSGSSTIIVPNAKELSKTLGVLNDQATAAGNGLKWVASSGEDVEKTAKAFEAIGANQLAEQVRKSQVALNGGDLTNYQASEALKAQATYVPSTKEMIGTNEWPRQAQIHQTERQTQLGLNVINPANAALQYLANPLTPYGKARFPTGPNAGLNAGKPTGQVPVGTGIGTGTEKKYQPYMPDMGTGYADQIKTFDAAFKKYTGDATASQDAVNKKVEIGRNALRELGVPEANITRIEELGQRIQGITADIGTKQLTLSVDSYTNQIRIANRSLGDARDMWGAINGDVKNTLGGMEGQNLVLARQSQLLGFMMEQRSINFKLAMAGFTAPGDTPESRQARIDQAKLEANYAQKQLTIQKQIGSNTYSINTIQAQRSIGDLVAQVDELTRGRALTIETKAAQDAVTALTQEQQLLMADVKTYMEQGLSFASQINAEMTSMEAKTGRIVSKFSGQLVAAFKDAGVAMGDAVMAAMTGNGQITINRGGAPGGTTGPGRGTGGPPTWSQPPTWSPPTTPPTTTPPAATPPPAPGSGPIIVPPVARAAGMLGTFSSPTQATFGEAGSETVAILRNPRSMMMPSGGGAGAGTVNVNININGGGGIDQKMLAVWGAQIQRETIAALNRKTSLLGLRTP